MVAELLQDLYGQVEHLPGPMIRALAPVLAQAQREVEKDLRAWLKREGGAGRFTTQRLRASLVQVRRTMERLRAGIEGKAFEGLRIGANAAGVLATGHVALEMERFGALFGETGWSAVQLDEAAILARGRALLVQRFRTSTRTYSREMRARIGAELAVSRLRNETVDEVAGRLHGAMESVFRGERWRAERLARTELQHAYNVQHELGVRELRAHDPEIRLRWDAYFDRRTCLQCASLDGKLIDPDGKGAKFRGEWTTKSGKTMRSTHDIPPAHPNCRCVPVAWHEDWKDDALREQDHDRVERERRGTVPRGTAVRAAPLPRGFERPATEGAPVPILRGLPAFGQVNPEGLYAVGIEDLRRAGLFALPGGGKDRARMARIRADWRAGKRTGPLSLVMGPDGRMFVDDGRHRLLTALGGGQGVPHTMLIRLDRAAPGVFTGTVPLK